MLTLIFSVIFLLLAWFLHGQRSGIRKHGRRLMRPPGTLPLAGNGIWFLQPRHRLLEWFAECEAKTGFETYEISVPTLPPGIVINDPKNVEHVLRDNQTFIKGNLFRARSWDLFGNGIINADGDLWRVQRKAGVRFFSLSNLTYFMNAILPPLMHDTMEQLDGVAERGEIIDLQSVLLELTTRFMGRVAYDMDIPTSLPFSQSFDLASGAIGNRFQNPFWILTEMVNGAPLRRAVAEVKSFGRVIVENAVQKRTSSVNQTAKPTGQGPDPVRNVLIDSLLDHIPDQSVVADAAMNFLSAGRDTTAQSMTWAIYMLLRHPSVQEQVMDELKLGFPTKGDRATTDMESNLPYTSAVFTETLRLFPPVPVELKETTQASAFPDGVVLPKGAVVMWIPWAMGRSKRIWGNDALDFRPERWLVRDQDGVRFLNERTAFEFPVFNAGPRSCLGQTLAETLAVHVIATLLNRYAIQASRLEIGEQIERHSQNSLTLPMENG